MDGHDTLQGDGAGGILLLLLRWHHRPKCTQTAITDVYDGTNIVLRLGSLASATTILNYPDTNAGNLVLPVKVPAGYFIQTTYGGAQGAAAYETCYCLKVKV